MKEIIKFLDESKVQYFATIGLDGKPKVRPFQFMFEDEGKLWFCTSNQKEVYKELQQKPFIELCASGAEMSWLRLQAKVEFVDNLKVKENIFEVNPLVKGIYKEANNPQFEVFYLDKILASISGIGKQTKIIKP